jgi:uncharacterized protein GlcG (DUF336 family)
MAITLEIATKIIDAALARGRADNMKPLTAAVVDDGGNLKALKREDGRGAAMRPDIAMGKAFAAVGMGRSTRALQDMAQQRPWFSASLVSVADCGYVPVPGGVLILDEDGNVLGAIGVTGDTADNDEIAAIAGIEAAGLKTEA